MSKNVPGETPVINRDQMLTALKRSGYLLEHRAEQLFASKGFHISNSNYFVDPDTDKLREIDLIAENSHIKLKARETGNIGTVTHRFICECENNAQPTVFFLSEGKYPDRGQGIIYNAIPHLTLPESANIGEHQMWGDGLINAQNVFPKHHFFNMHMATQYCSFAPREKKQYNGDWIAKHFDEQHDTLENLLKAAAYISERDSEGIDAFPLPYYGKYQVYLYYPLIVLQNELLTAKVTKDGIELQEADHVVYWKNHKIEDYEHLFAIDVIRESYLPKYIELIEDEIESLHTEILKNPYLKDSIEKWTERMIEGKEIESQEIGE